MTPHATEILKRLDQLNRALVAKGFPDMSPWWRETIRRFYGSGRRQAVLRVGRRGGKSSSLCRLAVLEALYGLHKVPPGDLGVIAFISTTRDEASQRLRTIKAILDALAVKYAPLDGGVELIGRRVAFKVYTASVSGVSGFTGIMVIADEVAKWKDADTGANPATEVLASVRPTMATQPEARIILSSSPYATLDAHYDAFERGDDDFQVVAHAPTWVANPTITEDATRLLERDEAVWKREYAALPQSELESSLFTLDELKSATRDSDAVLPPEIGHRYVAATDPATRRDKWTLVIATRRRLGALGLLRRSIVFAKEWAGTKAAPLNPDAVLKEMARICKPYGVTAAWTDQFAADALAAIGRRYDFGLWEDTLTAGRKLQLFEDLRTRVLDGEVELPPDDQVRADLLALRKQITRNGPTIEIPRVGGRHADYAPAVAMAIDRAASAPAHISAVPAEGTPEWIQWWGKREQDRMRKDSLRRYGRRQW